MLEGFQRYRNLERALRQVREVAGFYCLIEPPCRIPAEFLLSCFQAAFPASIETLVLCWTARAPRTDAGQGRRSDGRVKAGGVARMFEAWLGGGRGKSFNKLILQALTLRRQM